MPLKETHAQREYLVDTFRLKTSMLQTFSFLGILGNSLSAYRVKAFTFGVDLLNTGLEGTALVCGGVVPIG